MHSNVTWSPYFATSQLSNVIVFRLKFSKLVKKPHWHWHWLPVGLTCSQFRNRKFSSPFLLHAPTFWIYSLMITDHDNNHVEFCKLYWTHRKQKSKDEEITVILMRAWCIDGSEAKKLNNLWVKFIITKLVKQLLLPCHHSKCIIQNKRSESICPHEISCLESQIVKVEVKKQQQIWQQSLWYLWYCNTSQTVYRNPLLPKSGSKCWVLLLLLKVLIKRR